MKPEKIVIMKIFFSKYSYGFLLLFALFACDVDRNHSGYSYFPDMMHSRAYESYSENPNFSNGMTFRLPAEGSIPRGDLPFEFEKTEENRIWAGQNVFSPLESDRSRGKQLYEIYCINCHGEKGDGKGFLYTSGKYPYPPKSLITDKMKQNPAGEIFHVISVGYGVMGAHGSMISQKDRWKIVEYIQKELQISLNQ